MKQWNDLTPDERAQAIVGLAAPFADEQIKEYEADGRVYRYIDARAVMNRLDEVVGPANWMSHFELIDPPNNERPSGAVLCMLTVLGVMKSDIGYPNAPVGSTTKSGKTLEEEPLKAAASDALKRAAVHWGIGRHLYDDTSAKKGEQRANAGGGKEATEKQKALIERLCRERKWPVPNMEALPIGQAKAWIDTIFGGGQPDFGARGKPATEPTPRTAEAAPTPPREGEDGERWATTNQLETIGKLSRLLGRAVEERDYTVEEASRRIAELSKDYNEQQGARREGARP